MNDGTFILPAIEQGDLQAAEQLLPLIYDELRRLAARRLAHEAPEGGSQLDLLALHEALAKLESHDKRKAELVKLRFFAGLSIAETAQMLGISTSTADNDWAYARSWLRLEIEGSG